MCPELLITAAQRICGGGDWSLEEAVKPEFTSLLCRCEQRLAELW